MDEEKESVVRCNAVNGDDVNLDDVKYEESSSLKEIGKEGEKDLQNHYESQEAILDGEENLKLLITDLPMEVIVHIYDFLPLSSRYNASMACHILYEAFNHPKLWHAQRLMINGDVINYGSTYFGNCTRTVPNKTKHLIAKFGKYFQLLTIQVYGHLGKLQEWSSVLLELSQQCRLEKLTLVVGKMTTESDLLGRPPKKKDMDILLSFIQNAFRIKHLDIKSWPLFPETMFLDDQNIFKALMKNTKLKELEQLDLFWPYTNLMWSERQPILPDSNMVLELIKYLGNLKKLGLRSTMLSDALLEALAFSGRSSRISLIRIFVTYAKGKPEYQIPNIKSLSWKRLTDINPDFHVECHVMPRLPSIELGNMLTLDCPLSKIMFLQWSRIDDQLIESIVNKFNQTLKTFEVYCDFKDYDDTLIKMVAECKFLENLVIRSCSTHCVNVETIKKLAFWRGTRWVTFQFDEKNISFVDKPHSIEEDTVVAQNENGEYFLVGMHQFHAEPEGKERSMKCQELKDSLAVILGQKFISRNKAIIIDRNSTV
ncbi:F-box/LRR-repeat protein 3-like [Mytilus californianus]|uniref:F-box/LRR-repeat protein 3-like n=1 Tax=Mytilus californianus TaxID=6549 RepID=UPI002246E16D|nr:F-box/LRR-repeat protein 3-like [Mytilus californianus]